MPFRHGSYRPEATAQTFVIEICTACGQPAVDDL